MGNFVADTNRIWPDSRIPYAWGAGLTSAEISKQQKSVGNPERRAVEAAITEWNRVLKGSVQWRPATDKDVSRVVFAKDTGFNRSETLGRKRGDQGQPEAQFLYVNMERVTGLMRLGHVTPVGVLLHEMGHAAGLGHEHQRSDRDKHVRVDSSNVARCCEFRLKESKECACKMRFIDCKPFGPYDYGSTMHYFANQAAKQETKPVLVAIDKGGKVMTPQPKMGGLIGLKGSDIETLRHYYRGGSKLEEVTSRSNRP